MWKPERTTFMAISSAFLAVAPKCPICFLAYFGIFGVATASTAAYRVWLLPMTVTSLALTVGMLGFGGTGRRLGPVFLGVGASAAVLAGKFVLDDRIIVLFGIAALVAATVWRSWLRRRNTSCKECEQLPLAH